jgi:alanine racemase
MAGSATYTTNRPTRSGVVAIGYADGYPRHAPSGTPVIINGKHARIMGNISMDMMTMEELHRLVSSDNPAVIFWKRVSCWRVESLFKSSAQAKWVMRIIRRTFPLFFSV